MKTNENIRKTLQAEKMIVQHAACWIIHTSKRTKR